MLKEKVARKLAIIMYRDKFEGKLDPILKYLTEERAVKIDRYITHLYNKNELFPYSTRELIYTDNIPNGSDGSISEENILERMLFLRNTDLKDVMPVGDWILPFHPYIN